MMPFIPFVILTVIASGYFVNGKPLSSLAKMSAGLQPWRESAPLITFGPESSFLEARARLSSIFNRPADCTAGLVTCAAQMGDSDTTSYECKAASTEGCKQLSGNSKCETADGNLDGQYCCPLSQRSTATDVFEFCLDAHFPTATGVRFSIGASATLKKTFHQLEAAVEGKGKWLSTQEISGILMGGVQVWRFPEVHVFLQASTTLKCSKIYESGPDGVRPSTFKEPSYWDCVKAGFAEMFKSANPEIKKLLKSQATLESEAFLAKTKSHQVDIAKALIQSFGFFYEEGPKQVPKLLTKNDAIDTPNWKEENKKEFQDEIATWKTIDSLGAIPAWFETHLNVEKKKHSITKNSFTKAAKLCKLITMQIIEMSEHAKVDGLNHNIVRYMTDLYGKSMFQALFPQAFFDPLKKVKVKINAQPIEEQDGNAKIEDDLRPYTSFGCSYEPAAEHMTPIEAFAELLKAAYPDDPADAEASSAETGSASLPWQKAFSKVSSSTSTKHFVRHGGVLCRLGISNVNNDDMKRDTVLPSQVIFYMPNLAKAWLVTRCLIVKLSEKESVENCIKQHFPLQGGAEDPSLDEQAEKERMRTGESYLKKGTTLRMLHDGNGRPPAAKAAEYLNLFFDNQKDLLATDLQRLLEMLNMKGEAPPTNVMSMWANPWERQQEAAKQKLEGSTKGLQQAVSGFDLTFEATVGLGVSVSDFKGRWMKFDAARQFSLCGENSDPIRLTLAYKYNKEGSATALMSNYNLKRDETTKQCKVFPVASCADAVSRAFHSKQEAFDKCNTINTPQQCKGVLVFRQSGKCDPSYVPYTEDLDQDAYTSQACALGDNVGGATGTPLAVFERSLVSPSGNAASQLSRVAGASSHQFCFQADLNFKWGIHVEFELCKAIGPGWNLAVGVRLYRELTTGTSGSSVEEKLVDNAIAFYSGILHFGKYYEAETKKWELNDAVKKKSYFQRMKRMRKIASSFRSIFQNYAELLQAQDTAGSSSFFPKFEFSSISLSQFIALGIEYSFDSVAGHNVRFVSYRASKYTGTIPVGLAGMQLNIFRGSETDITTSLLKSIRGSETCKDGDTPLFQEAQQREGSQTCAVPAATAESSAAMESVFDDLIAPFTPAKTLCGYCKSFEAAVRPENGEARSPSCSTITDAKDKAICNLARLLLYARIMEEGGGQTQVHTGEVHGKTAAVVALAKSLAGLHGVGLDRATSSAISTQTSKFGGKFKEIVKRAVHKVKKVYVDTESLKVGMQQQKNHLVHLTEKQAVQQLQKWITDSDQNQDLHTQGPCQRVDLCYSSCPARTHVSDVTGCAYFMPARQVGKQVLVRGTLCQATGDSDEPQQHHLLATCWDDRDLPQETPIFTVNGATNTPAETTSQFLNEGTQWWLGDEVSGEGNPASPIELIGTDPGSIQAVGSMVNLEPSDGEEFARNEADHADEDHRAIDDQIMEVLSSSNDA